MKQRFAPLVVHLLFWLLTLLGMVLFTRVSLSFSFQHLVLVAAVVLNFYAQSFLAQRFLYQSFSARGLLLIVGLGFLFWFFDVVLLSAVLPDSTPGLVWLLAALALALYCSLLGVLFQGFCFSFSQRRQQQQLENEKMELELSLVRSQLNPHFLFNVLNNIDHYVRKDPQKASRSIIQLSSLLRYLLYETSQTQVPLAREVAFLEEYVDLQKQRIQAGNTCTFRKEITDPGLMVMPALFLPFLENAFSHCPLNQPGNFLYFELTGIPGKITFVGRNTRQVVTQSDRVGLGLGLARKRLALLYPNAHQLHILETEHHFSVELILQVR